MLLFLKECIKISHAQSSKDVLKLDKKGWTKLLKKGYQGTSIIGGTWTYNGRMVEHARTHITVEDQNCKNPHHRVELLFGGFCTTGFKNRKSTVSIVVCAKYGSNSTGKYGHKSIDDVKIKSGRRERQNKSAAHNLWMKW
jgi:hypothetical protein